MKKDIVFQEKKKKTQLNHNLLTSFSIECIFLRLIALLTHYQTQINQQDINEIKTALETFGVQASWMFSSGRFPLPTSVNQQWWSDAKILEKPGSLREQCTHKVHIGMLPN